MQKLTLDGKEYIIKNVNVDIIDGNDMKYITKDADTYITDDMYQELTYFKNKVNYYHDNHIVTASGTHDCAYNVMMDAYKKHKMINKQAYEDLILEMKYSIEDEWMPY